MKESLSRYKPDWREARARLLDWWAGKSIDRVPVNMTAWRDDAPSPRTLRPPPGVSADYDSIFEHHQRMLRARYWCGEAFPRYWPYMGAMFCVAYLGCTPRPRDGKVWYDRPEGLSWDNADRLHFDPQNPWWQRAKALTRRAVEESRGEYLVAFGPYLQAALDVMCELFGNQETMLAMVDRPDDVKRLRDRIHAWGRQSYEELAEIIAPHQEGTMPWLDLWAPGRSCCTQVDMSVMISPCMFEEFAVDDIRGATDHVRYGMYHLDGPGQIGHLDAILNIDSVRCVEWVPGARAREAHAHDPMPWLDLFKRIQDAGRKVMILCPPSRIEDLLKSIDRKNVYLYILGTLTRAEADAVLRTLARYGT